MAHKDATQGGRGLIYWDVRTGRVYSSAKQENVEIPEGGGHVNCHM